MKKAAKQSPLALFTAFLGGVQKLLTIRPLGI
jgi:hypothetical protein